MCKNLWKIFYVQICKTTVRFYNHIPMYSRDFSCFSQGIRVYEDPPIISWTEKD
jgi:hypothetical protein